MAKEIKKMKHFVNAKSNNDGKLVCIDFYGDWCAPCKKIAPFIDQLALKYTNTQFYKINSG